MDAFVEREMSKGKWREGRVEKEDGNLPVQMVEYSVELMDISTAER